MNIYEYCPDCMGEVQFKNEGFKVYVCPNCKSELLPCSICDVYTDNKVKIYTQSFSKELKCAMI